MSQIKSDQRVRLNRLYSYLVEHLSTIYITSTLKLLRVILVIWLDLIGTINSQIAPFFFALNRIFFPAIAVALLKCNNQLLIQRNQSNCRDIYILKRYCRDIYIIHYIKITKEKKFLQLPKDQFTTGSTKHLNRLKNRVSKNKQKTFWTKHEPIWLCSSLVSGLIISHQCPKEAIVTA